mmetsp:Transcript_18618/g.43154  ORF Transcript_18618/g.43154 Transcript_18618/m.43154 type:complete len:170 (-) Transcript_18618:122-631(-)
MVEKRLAWRCVRSVVFASLMCILCVLNACAPSRFPTRYLLEDYNVEAPMDMSTFPKLGSPEAIANLLTLRRESERPGESDSDEIIEPRYSEDGKELRYKVRTVIKVQKPDMMMEMYGVTELVRITDVKASLKVNDGYIMAVFVGGPEKEFQGPDGVALHAIVESFVPLE